jgi:hypothetical protein
LGVGEGLGFGVGSDELELLKEGGGAPRFARGVGGLEADDEEELLALGWQRALLLLLRRTVLATRWSSGTTSGSGARSSMAATTARWRLTLRKAWGVVRADAESATENKRKHFEIEGMVAEDKTIKVKDKRVPTRGGLNEGRSRLSLIKRKVLSDTTRDIEMRLWGRVARVGWQE